MEGNDNEVSSMALSRPGGQPSSPSSPYCRTTLATPDNTDATEVTHELRQSAENATVTLLMMTTGR